MIGAIAGDIIGSVYEGRKARTKKFPLFRDTSVFTDDTVLTCAVANAVLNKTTYEDNVKKFASLYPNAGYGGRFYYWFMSEENKPYNSWGNGSAMRVSPIGFAFDSMNTVLKQAKMSAEITHNHPEGIKGAQATAGAVFLAKNGKTKLEIKNFIEREFGYNMNFTLDQLIKNYGFDVSCQGSVPQSIFAFLESSDYEDTIRNCVAIGGDTDTIACIAGGLAQAFYKTIPENIIDQCIKRLDDRLWKIVKKFNAKFKVKF
jgi:ADP-ribosylglycohydrolase